MSLTAKLIETQHPGLLGSASATVRWDRGPSPAILGGLSPCMDAAMHVGHEIMEMHTAFALAVTYPKNMSISMVLPRPTVSPDVEALQRRWLAVLAAEEPANALDFR